MLCPFAGQDRPQMPGTLGSSLVAGVLAGPGLAARITERRVRLVAVAIPVLGPRGGRRVNRDPVPVEAPSARRIASDHPVDDLQRAPYVRVGRRKDSQPGQLEEARVD